jgi:carbonic anhydrase
MKINLCLLFAGLAVPLAATTTPPAAGSVSADEALVQLREGNARFVHATTSRPHQDAARRAEVAGGQHPHAVVLSCSDSRVPPEIVFDQGLGDLFVIRVAGNVAGVTETATVEYGTLHLGAPLCVVLGHANCGAVKAAVDGGPLEGNLPALIGAVVPAAKRVHELQPKAAGNALVAAVVETNVWLSIETLFSRSEPLRELAASGKLRIVGAVYDLASGEIHWLGTHPEQARLLATAEKKTP